MKEMLLKLNNVNDERIKKDIGRPCRVLSNVQFEMIEHDKNDASMPNVDINFSFRMSAYKEIKRVRAMDIQALIGNVRQYLFSSLIFLYCSYYSKKGELQF